MTFDKPIIIQKIDDTTERWTDAYRLHASVNKSGGSEYLNAGANQSKANLVFEVRYFEHIEDINFNRGRYRIVYRGHNFNITDYDDFLEKHQTVKLLGTSY